MDHKSFCYWLNGYFEISEAAGVEPEFTPEVVKMIKSHLDLVFNKVTPWIQYPDFRVKPLDITRTPPTLVC